VLVDHEGGKKKLTGAIRGRFEETRLSGKRGKARRSKERVGQSVLKEKRSGEGLKKGGLEGEGAEGEKSGF